MKYETGEKFTQKLTANIFEVRGRYPKSGGVRLDTNADNYYKITVDGIDMYLSEQSIDLLLQKYAGQMERIEKFEVKAPIDSPALPTIETMAETINQKPKKKKKTVE